MVTDEPAPSADSPPPLTPRTLILGQSVDVHGAAGLLAELAQEEHHGGLVALDGSVVTGVEAAGVQVLLAFAAARRKAGLSFRLDASEPLREALRLLGVSDLLLGGD